MCKQSAVSVRLNEFRPYLYVDTGEPPSRDNISRHYLSFDVEFTALRIGDQLLQIMNTIQSHMDKNQGRLGGSGYIRRYFFVFDNTMALELSPAGHIIAAHEDFDLPEFQTYGKIKIEVAQ